MPIDLPERLLTETEHLPCLARRVSKDALAAVADGAADLAMIPIENSIAGRRRRHPPSLADREPIHRRRIFLADPVSIAGSVSPPRRYPRRIARSHVHALGQCRKIIRRLGLVPHITADTAGSAREVAEWRDPTRTSLATKLAAEIYDLDVLAADVEDEKHNTTRFVVLQKTPQWPPPNNGPYVTSFVFVSATFRPPSTRHSAASPPMAST